MALSATEEHGMLPFRSHASLVNPHKEGKVKRICSSEPFIKPTMSLMEVKLIHQKILNYFNSKKPQSDKTDISTGHSENIPREPASEVQPVLQDPGCITEENTVRVSHKPSEITDKSLRTIPYKKKLWESLSLKQRIRRKHRSKNTSNHSSVVMSLVLPQSQCGLQIPVSDWANITGPSAKVTLDPNTANPFLKLSKDGRSVRTKTFEEYENSRSFYEHQRKHKYNSGWTCVQAEEGYSTGRHYWEVDVKGKCDWRVGVVKESAKHSGYAKLNTETGYWTLRLQLGTLIALTEPATKLNQAPPSKIGVDLDLEEGQVSFYDAVKRKHIYTFKTDFSNCEKIYPVFGTVETDKPLKII